MLARQKSTFNSTYFMDIVMIVDWSISKERNAYIFNGKAPSVAAWKAIFKSEVKLHLHRLPPHYHFVIMSWLDTL